MSFEFDFTPDKLAACFPNNPRAVDWWPHVEVNLPEYEINTLHRVAQWLAQMGHESGDLRTTTENLNYRVSALTAKFGNRISAADAAKYGRVDRSPGNPGQPANQEAIANIIYGGAWGRRNLGNTEPGDGWKFRGRGLIQITGRHNYESCSFALYGDGILLDEPEILAEPDGAVRSACWYWNSRNLNPVADRQDTRAVTRLINGGFNGLEDRLSRYNRYVRILGA